MSDPQPRTRRRGAAVLLAAWAIFAAYVVAARGIRNSFPISVFDMYQGRGTDTAARVVVRDAVGGKPEIDAFERFECYPTLPMITEVKRFCSGEHQPLDYVTRDQQQTLEQRLVRGPSERPQGEQVAIVSRAWFLRASPGTPAFTDCVIAHCTAKRKDAP